MSIKKGKFWILILFVSMNALLTACTSIPPLTSAHNALSDVTFDNLNRQEHEALANEFENKANEMQAKAEELKELNKNKPYSRQFGKNRENTKSRIEYKIHMYEQTAAEYRDKATSHQKMAAELTMRDSAENLKVDADNKNRQLDKAKAILDESSESGSIGKF